jgi:hypothetical protein
MIADYGFRTNDSLVIRFEQMDDDASMVLCRKANEEYGLLIGRALETKESGNYILALTQAGEAVEYSLEHLQCMIDDSRAWYEKVVLEPLATFQEKEMKLRKYTGISPQEYTKTYQDYSSYYYRKKLLDQGIQIRSLYQQVLQSDDLEFLHGFLLQYIRQHNPEPALDVLKRMHALGAEASYVSDAQKDLGKHLAQRDANSVQTDKPWELLDRYIGQDAWYNDLRWAYRMTWISKSSWNIKYWPFIWKK